MISTKAFALAAVLLALPRASESAGGSAQAGQTTVVVVGAGASGLSAARKITDEWPSTLGKVEVIVLEARERTGGRIWTNRNAAGFSGWGSSPLGGEADLGASWIHGSNNIHPVTILANKFGLPTSPTDDDMSVTAVCPSSRVSSSTTACPKATDDVADESYETYKSILESAQVAVDGWASDPSMWTAINAVPSTNGVSADDPFFQHTVSNALEFSTGANANDLSAWYYNDDSAYIGTERIFPAGYAGITDGLASGAGGAGAPLDVRLGVEVTNINYQNTFTTVQYRKVGSQATTIKADFVVLTVPLGVLKTSPNLLTPSMPFAMQAAVDNLGMGNVNKLVLKFDDTSWLPNSWAHYYGVADEVGDNRGLFTYFLNLKAITGQNILITFGVGAAASIADDMTDAQAWAKARQNMVKIFGNSIPLQPAAIMRSDWSNDQYAKGTYTYARPGTSGAYFDRFTEALDNKVFLAGEHTSNSYRATVHGAVLTGERAASAIISRQTTLGAVAPTQPPIDVEAIQAKVTADAAKAQADADAAAAAAKAKADSDAAASAAAASAAKAQADADAAAGAAAKAKADSDAAASAAKAQADADTAAAAKADSDTAAVAAKAQADADADAAAAAKAKADSDVDAAAAAKAKADSDAAADATKAQADADGAADAAAAAKADSDTVAAAAKAQADADTAAAAVAKAKADSDAAAMEATIDDPAATPAPTPSPAAETPAAVTNAAAAEGKMATAVEHDHNGDGVADHNGRKNKGGKGNRGKAAKAAKAAKSAKSATSAELLTLSKPAAAQAEHVSPVTLLASASLMAAAVVAVAVGLRQRRVRSTYQRLEAIEANPVSI